jgi:hypothetical protein
MDIGQKAREGQMRFLVKVTIPVESGNVVAKAGRLGKTIESNGALNLEWLIPGSGVMGR